MSSGWDDTLYVDLQNKEFRDAYLADQVRTGIAFQLRAMREQPERGWSQTQLAEKIGKHQPVVARLEDPDYGRVTLTTLLEAASAFDVALLVQFVEWDDFLKRMEDVSPSGLQKRPFNAVSIEKRRRDHSARRKGQTSNVLEHPMVNQYLTDANDVQMSLDFDTGGKKRDQFEYRVETLSA
jgi:transcriptional regulator with XRE-family HTH domain